jgi:perosamine synthetase
VSQPVSPIHIPLSNPWFDPAEEAALLETLRSGWVSTASPVVRQFEARLTAHFITTDTVATNCGTAALHLAMIALGLGPGDEVIVPALTFVASVNPVRYVGATPVFADIDPTTLGLTVATVARVVTPKTKAIVAVHLMGMPCDIAPLAEFCRQHGIALIEDAAEALGATVGGQPVGTFGQFGALSFNGNKTITTGSGGALLCRSGQQAQWLRGLSAQNRLLGSDEIEHVGLGYNYRMNALQAALGLVQWDKLPQFVARRMAIAARYQAAWATASFGRMVWRDPVASGATACYWLSCFVVDDPAHRLPLIAYLQRHGIEARPLFKPLPMQLPFAECHAPDMTHATDRWQRVVCIPSSPQMTDAEQDEVIACLEGYFAQCISSVFSRETLFQ